MYLNAHFLYAMKTVSSNYDISHRIYRTIEIVVNSNSPYTFNIFVINNFTSTTSSVNNLGCCMWRILAKSVLPRSSFKHKMIKIRRYSTVFITANNVAPKYFSNIYLLANFICSCTSTILKTKTHTQTFLKINLW